MKPGHMICSMAAMSLMIGVTIVARPVHAQSPGASNGGDLGAYSREATDAAKARLKETIVAVFAGGRYGFVKGERVSLDPDDWRTEAVIIKGRVMVPKAFALSAFGIRRLPWFGLRIASKKGRVSISDLAARQKKKVFRDERGLVIVTDQPMTLTDSELIDSIVTLFDTPEKFADPAIAYRNIPSLKAWGNWKEHVRFTPEQLARYDGPEAKWSLTPASRYDDTGLRPQELDSALLPVGMHPRVLFCPADVPAIAERIKSSRVGRTSWSEVRRLLGLSWLDPSTNDGVIFRTLCSGDLAGLEMNDETIQGQMLGVQPRENDYVMRWLNIMALYSLLTNDDDLGKRAAEAIHSYCKLLEPRVDACRGQVDVFNTAWGAMSRLVGGADLALSYDFAARWMTDEQKRLVRRVIAKAVSGRRGYGQDGPARTRDASGVTKDLTLFLANVAIEGEEGFDREVYDRGVETVKAFLQWGITPAGTLRESNGDGDTGMETLMLSMIALARRGENMFGHPHLRRLLSSQVQCTSPGGCLTASRGAGGSHVSVLKTFYPDDPCADFLLAWANDVRNRQDPLPDPTHPDFSRTFLYEAGWDSVARAELGLPLDFSDMSSGLFSSRSDNSDTALWISMQARPDLYLGASSGQHDAGSFCLEADGVLWGDGHRESQTDGAAGGQAIVFINGVGQDDGTGLAPPRVDYLGAEVAKSGAVASVDLTYAYDYRWSTCIENWEEKRVTDRRWEIETDPFVVNALKGTQRYRVNFGCEPLHNPWFPTLRTEFHPVEHAFRSVGLVRGRHPYVVIIDDIRKDDYVRPYEWRMMGEHGTESMAGLGEEDLVLTETRGSEARRGAPMLLIREVGPSACRLENDQGRTCVSTDAVEPRFRLLLVPFRKGGEISKTTVDESGEFVTLQWRNQQDTLQFTVGRDNRTHLSVQRDGEEILRSKW